MLLRLQACSADDEGDDGDATLVNTLADGANAVVIVHKHSAINILTIYVFILYDDDVDVGDVDDNDNDGDGSDTLRQ